MLIVPRNLAKKEASGLGLLVITSHNYSVILLCIGLGLPAWGVLFITDFFGLPAPYCFTNISFIFFAGNSSDSAGGFSFSHFPPLVTVRIPGGRESVLFNYLAKKKNSSPLFYFPLKRRGKPPRASPLVAF